MESDPSPRRQAFLHDPLQTDEYPAGDEQDIARVQRDTLRIRLPAFSRQFDLRALDQFEQRLLHAFARYIASTERGFTRPCQLVDLVDVNDARFREFPVPVRRIEQA
jgi:hypothetical protein